MDHYFFVWGEGGRAWAILNKNRKKMVGRKKKQKEDVTAG